MGRVIFMCGPAGSGKSTIARQYERQGMTRLSFDQAAWSRGITTMPLPEDVHRDIEATLCARLLDLVRAGADVVLDFSFWTLSMRDDYRELLRPFGVVPETVYLATDRATALQRIAARAAGDGVDFQLSTELAAAYFDHFEVPTSAEGPLTVLTGTTPALPDDGHDLRRRPRAAESDAAGVARGQTVLAKPGTALAGQAPTSSAHPAIAAETAATLPPYLMAPPLVDHHP